jgi:ribosomal protein S27AE
MVPQPEMLTREEFASLLAVGETPVNGPPPEIPAEHSERLIAQGYVVHLSGRLRMTSPGRRRIDSSKIVGEDGRRCPRCNATAPFVAQMLDSAKGRTIRMFRCHCGEQTWVSDPT